MRNNFPRSWFIKGFMLTFIALVPVLVANRPSSGLAKSADEANPNAVGSISENVATQPLISNETSIPGMVEGMVMANYRSPLVVPAADFSSTGEAPDGFYFNFSGGYMAGVASSIGCVKAPAYLPDGVTVTAFSATLYDNDSIPISVALRRVNVSTGASDILAQVWSSGEDTIPHTWEAVSIDNANISYPLYAYYITTCVSSINERIYSANIYYTVP